MGPSGRGTRTTPSTVAGPARSLFKPRACQLVRRRVEWRSSSRRRRAARSGRRWPRRDAALGEGRARRRFGSKLSTPPNMRWKRQTAFPRGGPRGTVAQAPHRQHARAALGQLSAPRKLRMRAVGARPATSSASRAPRERPDLVLLRSWPARSSRCWRMARARCGARRGATSRARSRCSSRATSPEFCAKRSRGVSACASRSQNRMPSAGARGKTRRTMTRTTMTNMTNMPPRSWSAAQPRRPPPRRARKRPRCSLSGISPRPAPPWRRGACFSCSRTPRPRRETARKTRAARLARASSRSPRGSCRASPRRSGTARAARS